MDEFLGDALPESAIGALHNLYSKYKYMETSFEKSKSVYKSKIPDIEQTLELIEMMKAKQDEDEKMFTNFNLCDMIYLKSEVWNNYAAVKLSTECLTRS